MKRIMIFLGFLLYFTICLNASPNKIRYSEIDSVKIYFTNLNDRTFTSVSCEDFVERTPSQLMKLKVITKKMDFKRLIDLINNCKYQESKNPDIRIRIEFYKKKRLKHTLCISYWYMFFDRKTLVYSNEIFYEVVKLCNYYYYYPPRKH